jgi:nucleotide-binding universal stress UspA family protein
MDSIKGVLVPTDFSPTAWQAVLAGIKIAKISKAPLSLVHITQSENNKEYQDEVRSKLENIALNLSSIYGVSIDSIMVIGEPKSEIGKLINKLEIDMVVMGLNGTGGNEIGSLTGFIMHHLNCPVMVVPATKKEPAFV